MKLTQEEKRIRILIAIGWSLVNVYQWDESNPSVRLPKQFHVDKYGVIHNAPDMFCDLNAIHEAEKLLTETQFQTYLDWLDVSCGGELELSAMIDGSAFGFGLVHATAAQRAEAFGLTLNLWEAGQ